MTTRLPGWFSGWTYVLEIAHRPVLIYLKPLCFFPICKLMMIPAENLEDAETQKERKTNHISKR